MSYLDALESELARQFADVLGTRLARTTAYRAFAVLALAASSSASTPTIPSTSPSGVCSKPGCA